MNTMSLSAFRKLHQRIRIHTPMHVSVPPNSTVPYTLFPSNNVIPLSPIPSFLTPTPQLHMPVVLVLHRCWLSAHHLAMSVSHYSDENNMHHAPLAFLCPSRPGYVGATSATRIGEEIDRYIRMMDLLKIDTLEWLVARGVAGVPALEFCRHFPDRVRKLVLVDAVVRKRGSLTTHPLMWVKEWVRNGSDASTRRLYKKRSGASQQAPYNEPISLSEEASVVDGSLRRSGILMDLVRLGRMPAVPFYSDVQCPITCISSSQGSAYSFHHGLEDPQYTYLDALWLSQHLSHGKDPIPVKLTNDVCSEVGRVLWT